MKSLFGLVLVIAAGCSNPKETVRTEAYDALVAAEQSSKPKIAFMQYYFHPGKKFYDRNLDGQCDYEVLDEGYGEDGYGTVKKDDDFDGWYEVMIVEGGIELTRSNTVIREQVPKPPRKKDRPCTSCTKCPPWRSSREDQNVQDRGRLQVFMM